jgi:hypothetical protein
MNKSLAGCGVIFGVIGTLCAAVQHDLGWTLVGLGATLINLMSLLGIFDGPMGD